MSASRWAWGTAALSLLPVAGLFTTARIFYARDLSFFFWSRHLWLRETLFAGQAPWWEPYVAGGQSAIGDALNQLLMPMTLAIRLLPSDVVSFNLWVALPLPVAALGAFLYLRRRFAAGADAAAAFGALVFAASGPVASAVNMPNLAWSVALMPWVLAAAETPGPRREARLAVAFALQGLCGEPVTWVATGVLVAAVCPGKVGAGLGLALGALLASAQLVPTLAASMRAHRGQLATPDFWSLHPLSLWEAVAPHLFGNYFDAFLADLPWMGALNFGRDPFFYSLYVGPFVLLLASAGAARLRRNAAWVVVALVFTAAAMGGYTPFMPLVRRAVPPLMYFRFPVKYIVFAAFAVAVLAAEGWRELMDAPADDRRARILAWSGIAAGIALLVVTLLLTATPARLTMWSERIAIETHLKDAAAGAAFLARIAPPLALRAGGMLIAGALLVLLSRDRRYAGWLLAAVTCADLLVTNGALNPTVDAARLAPPAWFTAAAASPARLYIGGRVRGYMNTGDSDAAATWQIPAESTAILGRMELNAELPMAPSGWRVREALSYDLPYLWPAEYERAVRRFEQADPAARDAFLRRTGVRWCVLPDATRAYPSQDTWRVVADVADWNMRVYECHPDASRLAFAPEPRGVEALFDVRLPDDDRAGEARIVEDGGNRVTVEATLTRPALLVLRDSYDPAWQAEADGLPVPVLRANGLQRGVALGAGHHLVRFRYRPRELAIGLSLTVAAVVGVAFLAVSGVGGLRVRSGRIRRSIARASASPIGRDRGFTLIELMIVLAILAVVLAIAFTEYRNMQARGNEASALSSLRSIAVAQSQFAATCGNLKYAATLPALGQPVPATGEPFLSPDLTAGETIDKSGYRLHMAGKPLPDAPPACNGAPVADGYAAIADPLKPGVSGRRFYGVNADRVLYEDPQKSFAEDLPEKGAAPHGQEVK